MQSYDVVLVSVPADWRPLAMAECPADPPVLCSIAHQVKWRKAERIADRLNAALRGTTRRAVVSVLPTVTGRAQG